EEVAERIGVSRQAVAKWEAGRSGTSGNRTNERRFFSGYCPAVQNCFKYDRCP
ncbi:helix-turn-helix transcriptional regulator, partial [Blautia massiliensis (ex Durand et al. 2017)]|uniref:helix-turn-helix transcriptional regulator n=1 Tax=Blautia massiliensis (ex Durand et al. 2017) TaxID=1737424 RepID=UPI003FA40B2F